MLPDPDRFHAYIKAALVLVATLALGAFLVMLDARNNILQSQKSATDVASAHAHLLQEQVDRSLSATFALAAVLRQGDGHIDGFDNLAGEMLRLYGGISSLQLAPNGVISRIVPLAGNEAAIGHNLLEDRQRNLEAFSAIQTRKLTLAGPFTLRQGGVAVIGRLPVFLTDAKGRDSFWGFTSAVMRISDLLEASKLNPFSETDYEFELSRTHPDTGKRDVFARSSSASLPDPVSFAITVPNGKWTLSVAPVGGWISYRSLGIEAALVLVVGFLTALLAFNVFSRPDLLRREVASRTRDLSATNLALEAEIAVRRHAEDALRESETRLRTMADELEKRVVERTVELSLANGELQREIDERKSAQQNLQQEKERQQTLIKKLEDAQNQLLQSEKMASIGQLAAGVAHEINNPIGYVNSNFGTLRQYVDGLLNIIAAYEKEVDPLLAANPAAQANMAAAKSAAELDYLRSDLPDLLRETQDGVTRVSKIVQDLKAFSHVGETEWQPADLHAGLESTLNLVWNELKYKAEVKKEYGALPEVECIASQINQVFMNLLVNAAQAIDGKGIITLRSGQQDDFVWVEVADTGKGIKAENLTRVFEPFYTTKPVGKGTGLGLSLSYSIVKKHGGRIDVRSEPGRGSVFRVWLPIAKVAGAVPDSR